MAPPLDWVSTFVKFTKDFNLFQIHCNGTKYFILLDAVILDDFDDSKSTIDRVGCV